VLERLAMEVSGLAYRQDMLDSSAISRLGQTYQYTGPTETQICGHIFFVTVVFSYLKLPLQG